MVQPGQPAPKYQLVGHDGQTYGPRSFGRKKVALVFLPEVLDSRATEVLGELRKGVGRFFSAGVVPVGVSPADPERLAELRRRLELPFLLLSDPSALLAREYGVAAGPEGIVTSVALLAEDTTLLAVERDVTPEGLLDRLLEIASS